MSGRRVTDDASLDLEHLIPLAVPVCRQAGHLCPRTGPGRKPQYDDWKIAVMILCGVLKKKKSKSAQYRLICQPQNARMLQRLLELDRIPCRSNFFERYKRIWPVVQKAITLQGRVALREHVADAQVVAVDKSLMKARGPEWNTKDRKRNIVPKYLHGLDRQADWGKSDYHGWTYGYSYEVVVAATRGSIFLPLLASVDVASTNEHKSVVAKLDDLPASTRTILVDPGYDSNDLADRVELDEKERPNGRRYICPPQKGFVSDKPERGRRERQRRRRVKRLAFLKSRKGRRLYARRKETVEPFNGTFKGMFELEDHVWHRGLPNNETQVLIAVFAYQLLVRCHWKCGSRNAQVQYILDGL
jgi:hypothetical protein